VHGLAEDDLPVRLRGRALEDAGIEGRHRATLTLVEVVEVVAAAQRLDVLVDDVRVGGGGAPGEILASPKQDVEAEARERGAAGVDAAPVEIELQQELRVRVPDLRARNEERVTRCGTARGNEQRVARRDGICKVECRRRRTAGLEAPVHQHSVSGLQRRPRVVREAAVDADGRRGILLLRQPIPERRSSFGADTPTERVEEHRPTRLVAAADAEIRAEQRAHSDHVGGRPRP